MMLTVTCVQIRPLIASVVAPDTAIVVIPADMDIIVITVPFNLKGNVVVDLLQCHRYVKPACFVVYTF